MLEMILILNALFMVQCAFLIVEDVNYLIILPEEIQIKALALNHVDGIMQFTQKMKKVASMNIIQLKRMKEEHTF